METLTTLAIAGGGAALGILAFLGVLFWRGWRDEQRDEKERRE
jgi:hypothetical protein